jgi:hypothetical protein
LKRLQRAIEVIWTILWHNTAMQLASIEIDRIQIDPACGNSRQFKSRSMMKNLVGNALG